MLHHIFQPSWDFIAKINNYMTQHTVCKQTWFIANIYIHNYYVHTYIFCVNCICMVNTKCTQFIRTQHHTYTTPRFDILQQIHLNFLMNFSASYAGLFIYSSLFGCCCCCFAHGVVRWVKDSAGGWRQDTDIVQFLAKCSTTRCN